MIDDESASRVDVSVDGATRQPESGEGSDASNARSSRAIKVVLLALKTGPMFILALMMLFLWAATEGHVFLTFGNIGNILEQTSGVSVIALGQLLVILTRRQAEGSRGRLHPRGQVVLGMAGRLGAELAVST